jgi:putative Ca2+/H+ antiporter (TMEM165/GDT1 family)
LEAFISSFLVMLLAEAGDKSQMMAFSLTTRFRKPWMVILGVLVATLASHGLSAFFGAWIALKIPPRTMAIVLAAIFVGFGIWTLLQRTEGALGAYDAKKHRVRSFFTITLMLFLAQAGDRDQVATMALAAKFKDPVAVTLGSTLGMLVTDGAGIFISHKLAGRLPLRWIRRAAAGLFFAFGIWSVWGVF